MNQMSTKSPIAAATLEIINERLATLSTLKRLPGEKPNTVVSTLWGIIRSHSRTRQVEGGIYAAMERS